MSNAAHNSDDFLSIVKHFINIGHIHTFSTCQKIIAGGSFDRLRHGEEEPKGGVSCTISENGNSYVFIENKFAKIFKTINIKQKDVEQALLYLDKQLSKIPISSHIRLKADKDHPIFRIYEDVRKKYPLYIFSKITNEAEQEKIIIDESELGEFTHIALSEFNIVDMLISEIETEKVLTNDERVILVDCLNNIK